MPNYKGKKYPYTASGVMNYQSKKVDDLLKSRAKAAAKARNKRKGVRSKRKRGRRRCDIMLKFDISLLTNNNLRHDELAEVAYFVRALREVEL